METNNACRAWAEGDSILEEYHDHEWCRICHDDRFQFEMLCLEGASVGLSWKIIMHKREAYRKAFHFFDIEQCAALTDACPHSHTCNYDCFSTGKFSELLCCLGDKDEVQAY